ncbi:hypothetical protein GCM10010249_58580 [Streptomyces roseolilacinus]|uniref:Uncharacterized protein n=1 Tax=Streptomyces roseolilacinus TaxID=66904 RepID=A0A918EME7_9ACTN|nr:hypothetical protein GCM10010249_58580 [Streptomyces roseolilacinus]
MPHRRTTAGSQVQCQRPAAAEVSGRASPGPGAGAGCDPGGARTFSRQRLSDDPQPAGPKVGPKDAGPPCGPVGAAPRRAPPDVVDRPRRGLAKVGIRART